jgi:Iap family predicted aminopeptidase
MKVIERVKELSRFGELVTGDKKERKIVDLIKKFFEERKDISEIKIHPQEVINWDERVSFIECGNRIEAIALPYSPRTDLETKNFKIIETDNLLKIPVYYARYHSYDTLIFTIDDKMRKIVVKERPLLSNKPQYPPTVPAFFVRKRDINKIKGLTCRFYNDSTLKISTGYSIEIIKPGKTERESVYITTHHDHWFNGEHDNLLSVSILPEINSEFETHMISFTAEESGCFFSSFSWACGSKEFVKNLRIGEIKLTISLDNISPANGVQAFVTPGYKTKLEGLFNDIISSPSIYTDSYRFLKKGIPTITFSSIHYNNYHSEDDIIQQSEEIFIEDFIKKVNTLLANTNLLNPNLTEFTESLKSEMLELPLELKEKLSVVIDEPEKWYRKILTMMGGILYSNGEIKTVLFPSIVGIKEANYTDYLAIEDFRDFESDMLNENSNLFLSRLMKEEISKILSELN